MSPHPRDTIFPVRYTALAALAIIAILSGLASGFSLIEVMTRPGQPSSYAPVWANAASLSIAIYGITRLSPKPDHPFAPTNSRPVVVCIVLSVLALAFGLSPGGLWR